MVRGSDDGRLTYTDTGCSHTIWKGNFKSGTEPFGFGTVSCNCGEETRPSPQWLTVRLIPSNPIESGQVSKRF
jgi:hypothetical protein